MRREDERLLTGRGRYIADLSLPGEVHAAIVRATHAHALVRGIDTTAAEDALLILTGADPEIAALGRMPWEVAPPAAPASDMSTSDMTAPLQPILAGERVRYLGEPVAFVVARTAAAARDAAERVIVDYESLPAVTDVAAAAQPEAAHLWPDFADNVYFHAEKGDAAAVDAAFAAAAHVTRLGLSNNRLAANPMEPRGYVGAYDAGEARYTLHAAASKPHLLKRVIAKAVMRIAEDRIRVVARDVGGGFGSKNHVYPEQVLVLIAARRLGRPVKWIADRAEMMMSDAQGRDQVAEAALALDRDGKFLAIRAATIANLGAYLSPRGVVSPLAAGRTLPGVYAIPAAHLDIRAVFTNTIPTAPYRGAGQPEVMFLLERLVDCAARETGIASDELRRRNFIPAAAFPYRNALGVTYDSGAYAEVLDRGLALGRWAEFPARRAAALARGRYRGLGLSYTIEACGFGVDEEASVAIGADGRARVLIGTMSNGQSHETVYADLVAETLGLPAGAVDIVQGDTDVVPSGNGTGASRSITVGGSALALACRDLLATAVPLAARLLQTEPSRVLCAGGGFRDRDGQGTLSWRDLARAAADKTLAPDPAAPGLHARHRFSPTNYTFPNGCHLCELEVDPETGTVAVEAYVIVHDVGRAIGPRIVSGQLQGGVTQGIGQALLEEVVYDRPSGQLLSGSFLDYAMPRAHDLPPYAVDLCEIRSTVNPLGARSCGEAGPTAAPPAVINALIDALAPLGLRHLDMPATPLRVWQAIHRQAGDKGAPRTPAA